MWCINCQIETNNDVCPVCKQKTIEDVPTDVLWCHECKIPVQQTVNQSDYKICPICHSKMKHLSTDLRPVFPEERLLVELLIGKKPYEWIQKSVWASNSRYYVDGKSIPVASKVFQAADADDLIKKLAEYQEGNTYQYFDMYIMKFVQGNKNRLNWLKDEAFSFIKNTASKFEEEQIVLSFSGGKDSTVTADIVIKALSNPSLVHIFGDTTLEFPLTIEYAHRYRENNPQAIFQIAKNREQIFYDVCSDIGPPARMMRWCCSMFKTGPITRVLNNLYRNQQILTFYGIRKAESVSRSKYNRVEGNSEYVKIQKQTVASPIFFWRDIDVWLYMLAEKIDFNDIVGKEFKVVLNNQYYKKIDSRYVVSSSYDDLYNNSNNITLNIAGVIRGKKDNMYFAGCSFGGVRVVSFLRLFFRQWFVVDASVGNSECLSGKHRRI